MLAKLKSGIPSFALFIALACALAGCSGKQIDDNDPASLYKDAEEEVESNHLQIAIDKFRMIKNRFPYSKYSVDAQMRIADIYFMQESYAEAAAAYESFFDLHPKHERVPHAMFRAAKSYFNDIPTPVARDLGSAQKALDAYNEYLRKYPSTPESQEARADANTTRKYLAEKELYIANFYNKREQHDSAKPRYKKVIELYPETDAAREAKEKLAQIEKAGK